MNNEPIIAKKVKQIPFKCVFCGLESNFSSVSFLAHLDNLHFDISRELQRDEVLRLINLIFYSNIELAKNARKAKAEAKAETEALLKKKKANKKAKLIAYKKKLKNKIKKNSKSKNKSIWLIYTPMGNKR